MRQIFCENKKSDDQKNHVSDKVEISCGHHAGFGNENRKTGDSSKCKMIWKFEKISACRHHQCTEGQQEKMS